MKLKDFTRLRGPALISAALAVILLGCAAVPVVAGNPELTDRAVAFAVEDELQMDDAVSAGPIDIETADGIVTLGGTVDNVLARDRAARIAQVVKGVRAVINRIEVKPSVLRTDPAIREDVGDALLLDPATDRYEIDVRVEDYVVVLSGTVDSWQEKRLCETVAKGVKGVKRVDNRIAVAPAESRPDHEIEAEVEKMLSWDALIDHALIDVVVENGTVYLTGTVGSAAEKTDAVADAWVRGVKSVEADGLSVEKWAREDHLRGRKYAEKSPQEIEAAIEDALRYDPRVSLFEITPEVDGRMVTLRGVVDNLKARRAAGRDARNTVGVRWVENRIKVRPDEQPDDRRIEKTARDALRRDPYVDADEISIASRIGVVTLSGNAGSRFEKTRADDAVSRVEGVIMVDNNLVVQEHYYLKAYDPRVDERSYDFGRRVYRPRTPAKADWKIKQDIADEFFWSPFVDAEDIRVSVAYGVATLTGTVDSWPEYNAAAANAYDGGAVYVDNELTVK